MPPITLANCFSAFVLGGCVAIGARVGWEVAPFGASFFGCRGKPSGG
jgi:hypothetical protein